MTETRVDAVHKQADGTYEAVLSSGETARAEVILVAVGRRPNIADCGIPETGIVCTRGKIDVDEHMQTSIPGIYAVGDAVGKTFLAHTASHEGISVVEHLAGNKAAVRYEAIPRCVYTQVQIAGVGLSEHQAREKGIDLKTGKFPFTASGKALIEGSGQGFIKIITEAQTDAIIGASLCGPEVTELVHELSVAISSGMRSAQLASIVHAHPTLSEAVMEAAESVHGKAIHIF
jgi:Pyruvate/2-oxoglutarate dehydrogenase complex, dihydrolipoamide dehydrogenase (E3) component, and related enzymes